MFVILYLASKAPLHLIVLELGRMTSRISRAVSSSHAPSAKHPMRRSSQTSQSNTQGPADRSMGSWLSPQGNLTNSSIVSLRRSHISERKIIPVGTYGLIPADLIS